MTVTFIRTEITPLHEIAVDEEINGELHRRFINPGDDFSSETGEVLAACTEHHTAENIAAWKAAIASPSE